MQLGNSAIAVACLISYNTLTNQKYKQTDPVYLLCSWLETPRHWIVCVSTLIILLFCVLRSQTFQDEMKHVMNWAADNKMTVDLLKTVELVFQRPPTSHDLLPTELPDIKITSSAKLLGVYVRQDTNFSQHVGSVTVSCNQPSGRVTQTSPRHYHTWYCFSGCYT